jgi:DNA-directed RNA polymerase specialized sigma24 family protein
MTDDVNSLRPRMMSVAYRMLGSVADAADAVQVAWRAGFGPCTGPTTRTSWPAGR